MQTCGRCAGTGTLNIRRGYPGQDPRTIPGGVSAIQWNPAWTIDGSCNICHGSGTRPKKPEAPRKAVIRETAKQIDQETAAMHRQWVREGIEEHKGIETQ